jgi:hypothetical protein
MLSEGKRTMRPSRLVLCAVIAGLASAGAFGSTASTLADTAPAAAGIEQSAPKPPVPAPVYLSFSPESIDFGEMISGEPKTLSVKVTNTSKTPITVEAIKAGCGCTKVSDPPKGPVAPGATFTLDLTLDPGNKTGIDLVKAVHFLFDGGRTQSTHIKAHVKTVVRVSPDVVDATIMPAGAEAIVTLESVDGKLFTLTGAMPGDFVVLPKGSSASHRFEVDWKVWEKAGRPSKLTITTDRADAKELVIPIKGSPAVAMLRLPAAGDDARSTEARQDAAIRAIDAGLTKVGRSQELRMRLHRESGMLFVHGTDDDISTVREVVLALPASAGVRVAD